MNNLGKGPDTVTSNPGQLRKSLGTARLVFLVVAAAAPMAAVIGVVPVAFALGNGAGVPLTFVGVTAVLALFAVGYAAMSRRIVGTGAFYTYVARGLGATAGLGAAFVAVFSYTVFVAGALAYFSYFARAAVTDIVGVDIPWLWYAAVGGALVAVLGYRQIDLSSKLLAGLLVAEFVILALLVGSIVVHKGSDAFPAESLGTSALTSGAPGIAIMLAFTCFIGFESAALYSEEAHDPKRSISRATYISVGLIGAFYFVTTWATVGGVGADSVADIAGNQLGDMYFTLSTTYLSPLITQVMEVFLATSLFATTLAIHNVASRYMFALGRQRCLPHRLGRAHPRHASPYVASMTVTAITVVIVVVCWALGVEPLVGLGAVAIGFGTVGIIALQALTSLAVIAFFRATHGMSWWSTVVAPGLAFLGLVAAVVMAVSRFDLLSGNESTVIKYLPYALLAAFAVGCGYAQWNKHRRPHVHAALVDDSAIDNDLPGTVSTR